MTTPEPLVVDRRQDEGMTILEPHGVLDLASYAQLRDLMIKCALDLPLALIVELRSLWCPTTATLSVFTTVSMRVSDWPGVPILLVAADRRDRESLAANGITRFVPVFADLDAARRAGLDRCVPPRYRAMIELPTADSAAGAARRFLERACRRWGYHEQPAEDGAVVVNALVDNALRHGRGGPTVRVELRGHALTIAVADDGPAFVPPGQADSPASFGLGLMLVRGLARAWGCSPRPGGGKVVWAVLRPLDQG
jgi:anti-sigma regulatory factor (Ser/Thr protein kinase)